MSYFENMSANHKYISELSTAKHHITNSPSARIIKRGKHSRQNIRKKFIGYSIG